MVSWCKKIDMCGIAGLIGFSEKAAEEALGKMLNVIQHRGPDSHGWWSTEGFAFGMQRLSIIDLLNGDQPIWSQDGVGIVFNGEIYNFRKLRSVLEDRGVNFKTQSDTEVILELYLEKGIKAIDDLEGMFAICIYDPRNQKVYLVRDRLGVKPLYYYSQATTFIFGSEIKSILEVIPQKSVNNQAVWDYLTLRYVPGSETIWNHIYKLEPGHYLEYDLSAHEFKIERYWSIDFCSEKSKRNKNYEKEFEILFLEAVEKRLLASDVPVGILLSGGLDSSCIAAAAYELGHKNFHTFSIGFKEGGEFSELEYARKVAQHIGSNHHEILISQDEFIEFLDDFVWYSDEPIADLASIPLYYVSKLASSYVKVVLSGEGADEILAGYNFDKLANKLFYLKMASFLPNGILKLLPFESLKTMADSGYANLFSKNSLHITNIFSETEKANLCTFVGTRLTTSYLQDLYKTNQSLEPIDQLQQVYCRSWLVEDLLMKADKMSMATSLELRVPFLDHKLVEWATKLPLKWKVGTISDGFTTKRILRNFATRRLPAEIIRRPKQGFPVPAYQWLQNDLLEFSINNITEKHLLPWIDIEKLSPLLDQLKGGSIEAAHKVWNLLVFSIWVKRWV